MTEVSLPNLLRPHAGGQRSVKVEGATIGEVLETLQAQYPGMSGQLVTADGQLHRFVNVYVNEEDIRFLKNKQTPLKDGDEISIIPAIAGG